MVQFCKGKVAGSRTCISSKQSRDAVLELPSQPRLTSSPPLMRLKLAFASISELPMLCPLWRLCSSWLRSRRVASLACCVDFCFAAMGSLCACKAWGHSAVQILLCSNSIPLRMQNTRPILTASQRMLLGHAPHGIVSIQGR